MLDSASNLIRDTVAYLRDPLLPKQVIFASAEDCALFQRKQEIKQTAPYCAQASCVNSASARQSKIEAKRPNAAAIRGMAAGHSGTEVPDDRDHSRLGKADEEDRFGKVAASQNSYNLTGLSITPLPALPPAPTTYKEKAPLPAAPEKQVEKAPAPIPKVIVAAKEEKPAPPAPENLSPIAKTLQRIAPHIKLTDQVPDDAEAKRVSSAWKEKISDAEVVLIACDTQDDTLELLKGLAKAIDKNLAKSKVITADRLEREKRWDLFLQKNPLRLVIVSDGMQKFPELMRHYKSTPANAQFFLDQTPLLPLSSASVYKSLEHKALLWKTLCQMLKK